MVAIEPRCLFAVFADEYRPGNGGFDLLSVRNHVAVIPSHPGHAGVKPHRMTLFVMVYAAEGSHTLSFFHEGYEYMKPVEFEILPQHRNVFTQAVTQEFPVAFFHDTVLNAYPILLDGEPFTTAYLVADTL